MRVQTFLAELSAEGFGEGVVSRLTWPAKIQNHAPMIGPQVHVPSDKFRPVIHANGFGVTNLKTNPLWGIYDIFAAIAEFYIQNRNITREGINDSQDA